MPVPVPVANTAVFDRRNQTVHENKALKAARFATRKGT